jgi:hypothetical protein
VVWYEFIIRIYSFMRGKPGVSSVVEQMDISTAHKAESKTKGTRVSTFFILSNSAFNSASNNLISHES